nr:MAG TPA: putative DNA-binding protein [Caudoviricetes sp.]
MRACGVKGACNQPVCGVCGWKLVKNGRTSAGRTRWRCKSCGASTTQTRSDVMAKAEASLLRRWLLEEFSARQLGLAKTSFANKTHWC